MNEKIKKLLETLEQEINDGYNTLPDYQGTLENMDLLINEGRTYINMAQVTLTELQKELENENNNG
tara:strand:- start:930 stop:1127 length:198 start_codon:yes stop_codon:yes gene_type:complete